MISRLLSRAPAIDRELRKLYLRLTFPNRRERGFTYWTDARTQLQTVWEWAGATPEPGKLFFGYYDKSPWSPDGASMLMHFRRNSSDREIEICVFHRRSRSRQFVGRTRAWNFQQGAMSQWIVGRDRPLIIYNDVRNDLLVSRVVTAEGKEIAVVPMPVQTVHPDGSIALGLNYKRLLKLRKEYGYTPRVKNFSADMPLDKDGIWRADLTSGQFKLVLSLAELIQISPQPGMNTQRNKVNHIIFSPGGTRCVFMHRWFHANSKYSRLYVMNSSTLAFNLILDSGLISHYHWYDDEKLIVYGNTPDGETGYFELNVVTGRYQTFAKAALDPYGDGHPSVSPDKAWIVTDSYPDHRFQQHLLLYHLGRGQSVEAGRFLHSPQYYGVTRCDLHPRWSRDGQYLSFDSVWNGTRQSYILDVSRIVRDGL